jgi:hypothetical protein
MSIFKLKNGSTLAEVLITLSIIGVVAEKLKKLHSVMSQACLQAVNGRPFRDLAGAKQSG